MEIAQVLENQKVHHYAHDEVHAHIISFSRHYQKSSQLSKPQLWKNNKSISTKKIQHARIIQIHPPRQGIHIIWFASLTSHINKGRRESFHSCMLIHLLLFTLVMRCDLEKNANQPLSYYSYGLDFSFFFSLSLDSLGFLRLL